MLFMEKFPGAYALDLFKDLGKIISGFKGQSIRHFIYLHVIGKQHLLCLLDLPYVYVFRKSDLRVFLEEGGQVGGRQAEGLGNIIELELSAEIVVYIGLDGGYELILSGAPV